jgi:nucleotide-binding universal stress UspA family protein
MAIPNNTSAELEDPQAIKPYAVRQALIGLELAESDAALLQYVNFFTEHFPITRAKFLHVAPRFDLLLDSQILDEKYQLSQAIEQKMVDTLYEDLDRDPIANIEEEVREGSALEVLLDEAKGTNTDLIIIGQKSMAEHHAILAKKLARRVDCNALVVPSAANKSLSRILVPIDFSDHSIKALHTALAMNHRLDEPAEIACIHVYEMPDFASFNIGKTEEQFRNMIEKDRREALAAFIETHVPAADQEHVHQDIILKARPGIGRYLMDYAHAKNADFIVMGARGHSKIHVLFVGSVTEAILSENKKIPTLVVR